MASQSRRGFLSMGVAGLLAGFAQMLGAPRAALAATGDPLLLGQPNDAGASTELHSLAGNAAMITGAAVPGATVSGRMRVDGEVLPIPATWRIGVYGGIPDIVGGSIGVRGDGGTGVWGKGSDGAGVIGEGTTQGVLGRGGTPSSGGTGVQGEAASPLGVGVRAIGTNGASALVVSGRVSLSRSGSITIPKGLTTSSSPAPLGASTLVFATIQSGAIGIHLRAAKPTVSTQRITFYLNAAAPSPIKIAWLVIN